MVVSARPGLRGFCIQLLEILSHVQAGVEYSVPDSVIEVLARVLVSGPSAMPVSECPYPPPSPLPQKRILVPDLLLPIPTRFPSINNFPRPPSINPSPCLRNIRYHRLIPTGWASSPPGVGWDGDCRSRFHQSMNLLAYSSLFPPGWGGIFYYLLEPEMNQ